MKKFLLVILILTVLMCGAASVLALDLYPIIMPIDPIPILTVPAAPAGFGQGFMAQAGATSVTLEWADSSTNETGFRIESKNYNTFSWYTMATVGANVTSHTLEGLKPGTTYTMRVIAFNSFGDSNPSPEYEFMTPAEITLIQPNSGTLTGGQSYTIKWEIEGSPTGMFGGDVAISMCYNTDGSNDYPYIINRTTVMANDGSYNWIVPDISTTKLKVMILFSQSIGFYPTIVSDSNDTNITVVSPILLAPIKPSNLKAEAISSSEIELSWDQSGNDKTGFKIYRKSGLGIYSQIATVDHKTYKIIDNNLSPGTSYSYQVYAYNNFGNSAVSNTASAMTQFPSMIIIPLNMRPAEPEALTAETVGITQVNLSWNKGDSYATGFSLERKKATGIIGLFAEIANLGSSVTSYSDTGVVWGNTYQYRIRAYNAFGHSDYSDAVTIAMPLPDFMPIIPELIEPFIPTTEEAAEETPDDGYPSASDWAKPEIAQAVLYGLTTDHILDHFQQSITREEFCEIVVKLYEASSEKSAVAIDPNPFKDTMNPEILKAYRLGIVNGISADTFAPDKNITRQEICVMLLRQLKAVDPGQNYTAGGIGPFADEAQIAPWAIDSVKFMNQEMIMKGVGANNIDPLGNTTREQAIALVLRTYQQFGL
jgi:hypothetical protein